MNTLRRFFIILIISKPNNALQRYTVSTVGSMFQKSNNIDFRDNSISERLFPILHVPDFLYLQVYCYFFSFLLPQRHQDRRRERVLYPLLPNTYLDPPYKNKLPMPSSMGMSDSVNKQGAGETKHFSIE